MPTPADLQHPHNTNPPPGYFSPQPVRPYSAKLPTADPSPTPSLNSSTTSFSFVEANSQPPPTPERPGVQRDLSNTSTASAATVRANSVDPFHAYTPPPKQQRDGPHYPNQSYAALQFQHHPTATTTTTSSSSYASHAHPLRTRSSHPAHFSTQSVSYISTFGNASEYHRDIMETGSRTVGNSPASSPGLFSPVTPPSGHSQLSDDVNYSTLWLHPSQRNAPKETSVADIDIDPVSGRKIINQYEILSELGRGVHGKVKRGRDLITHREVAIKIVERYPKRKRLGKSDDNFREQIMREIAILKKARHPHIVGLLEVIDDPASKKIFIVLELVELGEVKWRTDATKEVALVEWRRYQRECRGVFDDEDEALEDEKIIKIAHRKLERQRQRAAQDMQRRRRRNTTENQAWSFETGADSGSEHDFAGSDQRSRSSTTMSTSHRSPTPVSSSRPDELSTFTGLEGTMYGAYDSPLFRDRTPSLAESSSSRFTDNGREIPEEFRYVPTLTIQATREVFRDAILGLEFLHYQGIVHRDIKPANLLQTSDHRIKISDFGVSYLGRKKTEDGEDGSESESGQVDGGDARELAKTVGTPAFFAPELCRTEVGADTPPVDFKIDIWALGVTLYCLVYGRIPFFSEHNNIFAVMKVISETEPYMPKYRLKPVAEPSSSRPSSHVWMYHAAQSSTRAPHDLEYEEVDDDLRDLLKRLLVKDPRHRIGIVDIKRHPWLLRGLENSISWVEATDPTSQGRRIQVSKDDVDKAVAPVTVIDRIRSGLRKTYDAVVRVGTRGGSRRRAQSTATGQEPTPSLSTNSSSSTISQEGRRPSLVMSQHIFEALGRSRDLDHPLTQSLTATPEAKDRSRFFDNSSSRTASPAQSNESREHLSPLSVSTRPLPPDRAHSAVSSSAASIRTIRQSDMPRPGGPLSPIIPPGLPGTPTALESPGGSNLSGILGGVPNRFIQSMRSRDRMLKPVRGPDRAKSTERLVGDPTAHSEPSVALSTTSAIGHVPDLLRELTSPGASDSYASDPIDRASSRQSSVSSASSRPRRTWSTNNDYEVDPNPNLNAITLPPLAREASEERFERAKDDLIRRRVLEETQSRERPRSGHFQRPPSSLSETACPPSPDDEMFLRHQHTGDYLDQYAPPSLNTSPASYSVEMAHTQPRDLTASSSEDRFTTMSQSTSNPSIPSAVSTNSSTVAPEECFRTGTPIGLPATGSADSIFLNQYDEVLDDASGYEGDNPLESDDQDDDSSDDEDFIVMGRKKPATAFARSGSISNAELARSSLKDAISHRRRSTRSGSDGTVKKVKPEAKSENDTTPEPA